jgi:putative protein-disulfide isomerase
MKLIFAGDPMCSWCYGFGKELTALMALHPTLPLQILVGGVRAGATDLLDDSGKQFRLAHWARVEQASGLPFNRDAFMARENFVYDTEPICRAVVATHRLAPAADQLAVFRALQHAFYVDGLDTTDGDVLAEVGVKALALQGQVLPAQAFRAEWDLPATIAATAAEFAKVRALGVRSFPALLLEVDGQMVDISPGYAAVDRLDGQLKLALRQYGVAA